MENVPFGVERVTKYTPLETIVFLCVWLFHTTFVDERSFSPEVENE